MLQIIIEIHFILLCIITHQKRITFLLFFLLLLLIITIFVVIEPSSPGPSSDTNGTFTLEDDNVCLLKVHNGYHLYVNGKYVGALDTIPDDFKNVTIYTRKEEIPHE